MINYQCHDIMLITKTDVYWNYGASSLRLASSALLFPFILKMMPSEMVGIWTIFMTVTAFAGLLDFGFNFSFARNVTYIFSGVKTLKINGFETVNTDDLIIDYGLLKGIISAMRWFYSWMAIVLFCLLSTLGTYYIYTLLQKYKGDHLEVFIAWTLLCIISTYNIFTLYYESLLQGIGLVKRSKQIVIIGQSVYLIIATILILAGNGLIAIVSAQASSVFVVRWLSYRSFFNHEIKLKLHTASASSKSDVLKAIAPNAVKIGLTSLGGFMVIRSATVIGSLNMPLKDIASYGVTMQLIGIIAGLAGIYFATYQPKIAQLRVVHQNQTIKELYIKSQFVMLLTYIAGGCGLLLLGEKVLSYIGSKTQLIPNEVVLMALIISLLENHHSIAGGILLSKNEVPFFKASLVSGFVTILLLLLLFQYTNLGIWAMILAPGLAQGLYQNWKWPMVVINELEITFRDIFETIRCYVNSTIILKNSK
jgi:O-antigen/teichoic acid export membrane protein